MKKLLLVSMLISAICSFAAEKSNVEYADNDELLFAIQYNQRPMIHSYEKELMKLLYNIDSRTINTRNRHSGMTPLITAIQSNNVHMVKFCLENEADVELTDGAYTPLTYAVKSNNAEIVQTLLNHGANINTENNDGTTAFKIACWYKYTDLIKIFLGAETVALAALTADTDTIDSNGNQRRRNVAIAQIMKMLLA